MMLLYPVHSQIAITMIAGRMRPDDRKLVPLKPNALARWVNGPYDGSSRKPHMIAATTMGTAKGMKKIVRKVRPNFAMPRSKTVAKKKAMTSMTGIWIAPKTTTRMTPDQNGPDV